MAEVEPVKIPVEVNVTINVSSDLLTPEAIDKFLEDLNKRFKPKEEPPCV